MQFIRFFERPIKAAMVATYLVVLLLVARYLV